MTIRKRLTLIFTGVVTVILIVFSTSIYWIASESRSESFYRRAKNKILNTERNLTENSVLNFDLITKMNKNVSTVLTQNKLVIINSKFETVYQLPEDDPMRIPSAEELTAIAANKSDLKYEDGSREILASAIETNNGKFYIKFGAKDEAGLDDLQSLKNILIIGTFASIGLSLFLGFVFSGQALQPIAAMIKEIESISENKLDHRVSVRVATDEMGQLATKFNQLLERLQQSFYLQKGFISNASHELRTPLTVMGGQLEVALMDEDLQPKTKLLLESLSEEIAQLKSLSNGLLNLAQTEIDISKITFANFRIDELLWQAKEDLEKAHPNYLIHIDFKTLPEEDSKLTFNCNESLLRTCFVNIIDNSCKYSADQTVKVWIELQTEFIQLTFIDQGIGIPEDELEKVMESFYRAPNAYAYNGHGIGLSLSKKILSLHKAQLEIESGRGVQGTRVKIKLPYLG